MDMIERVARAIWAQRREDARAYGVDLEEWGDGSIPAANGIRGEALAALKAMREPTDAMIAKGVTRAAGFASGGNRMCNGYRAMIEAALSETD